MLQQEPVSDVANIVIVRFKTALCRAVRNLSCYNLFLAAPHPISSALWSRTKLEPLGVSTAITVQSCIPTATQAEALLRILVVFELQTGFTHRLFTFPS